jgi:hypothetical protein
MTKTTPEAVPGTTTTRAEPHGWWSRRPWLHMFLGGLTLWMATVAVTLVTENANLVPTIILLGSFLVPVIFWLRLARNRVPPLLLCLAVGGWLLLARCCGSSPTGVPGRRSRSHPRRP